ncbi:MAG: hypothetical protein EZS26_002626 [Candidatus Ordinivivax streblomastigis]|uniref:FAS1 domain-containing protein n=1 Tax=Candidatus Ordinivivax streblomastigis TaxID=2540710 RepID=A0A5M8NXE0_9BACT|nr:MAG: hypothetical protein EZS26_002626 [Candidatus Ordinivivax streblomastigis]
MMKNKYLILLLVGCWAFSCKDAYDDHYNTGNGATVSDKSLAELITADVNLSTFSKLITIAGLTDELSSNQTFTVWAPTNEALATIDLQSITQEEAALIVYNHTTRFNVSTTTPDNQPIRMRDNKSFFFSDKATVFGGAKLLQHDILAKNGILHTLQSQLLYYANLYEYILSNPLTSNLADFISSFQEKIVDATAGSVTDMVMVDYNRLFDASFLYGTIDLGIGQINQEDLLYTMLVPTNTAWDAAYSRIAPYFKAIGADADSLQKQQTSLAILDDLIYQGEIANPASQSYLVSTSPFYTTGFSTVISNPAELFGGAEKIQASNGLIFQTDDLRYNNTETWNKPILVETELTQGRLLGSNTTVITRVVDDNFEELVSNNSYLYVEPSTPTAQPEVTFEIPQVLSGTYNIYVEFLPLYLDPQGKTGDKTKFVFNLSYKNANGTTTDRANNATNLIADANGVTRMLVYSNFEFPMANYYDRIWMIDYYKGLHKIDDRIVTTKLRIRTNVSNAEMNSGAYVRKFCVDRIILEPIQK